MSAILDESLVRLHATGPEFQGWLSNHGPMAADALERMGLGEAVEPWLDAYVRKLEPPPPSTGRIEDWRDALGEAARVGDWRDLFLDALAGAGWQDVLVTWWPRLLPGAVGAVAHPLIRTGHAVRALREQETPARVAELGHALGYWAARFHPLPDDGLDAATADESAGGTAGAGSVARGPWATGSALDVEPAREQWTAGSLELALARLPKVADAGGAQERLVELAADVRWVAATRAGATWPGSRAAVDVSRQEDMAAGDPHPDAGVPAAIDALTDAAVSRYGAWAPAEPTMLVHMATAPRAAGLVLPSLPRDLWPATYAMAWRVSAAVAAMYRPDGDPQTRRRRPVSRPYSESGTAPETELAVGEAEASDVAERAWATGDEHAIKFTETALESWGRGNVHALSAARLSADLA